MTAWSAGRSEEAAVTEQDLHIANAEIADHGAAAVAAQLPGHGEAGLVRVLPLGGGAVHPRPTVTEWIILVQHSPIRVLKAIVTGPCGAFPAVTPV
jgi:hypothetical protein